MKTRKIALWLGIAPMALGATFFAACGGDDDGGGGGSGSDEDFVAGLCEGALKFQKDIEKLLSDPSKFEDEEDAAKAFADPFEDFANSFGKLKAPSDLKDWHKEASDKLDEAVESLKDGDVDADIFSGDQPFEDPPKAAADRLTKVAEKNEDCEEADFDFES